MTAGQHNQLNRPRPSLSHGLEYVAFFSIRWIFERLTVPQAAALSAFFWRLIAPRLTRHKPAISNLKAALPELNSRERQQLLTRMWDNLGRTSAETLRLN